MYVLYVYLIPEAPFFFLFQFFSRLNLYLIEALCPIQYHFSESLRPFADFRPRIQKYFHFMPYVRMIPGTTRGVIWQTNLPAPLLRLSHEIRFYFTPHVTPIVPSSLSDVKQLMKRWGRMVWKRIHLRFCNYVSVYNLHYEKYEIESFSFSFSCTLCWVKLVYFYAAVHFLIWT